VGSGVENPIRQTVVVTVMSVVMIVVTVPIVTVSIVAMAVAVVSRHASNLLHLGGQSTAPNGSASSLAT